MPLHPKPGPAQPTEHVTTRDGYDRWSQLYDDEFNPLIEIEQPLLRRRVGDPGGRRVLDVGTGTGRQALWAAGQGAVVTALDFSTGMLDRARAKPGFERITLIEHDLLKPWPLPDDGFDIVLSALVLDHVSDLPHFFAQCARVVAPGGRVICSVMHPAMMLRGLQARFADPETGTKIMPASAPNEISDYLNAAIQAGLVLDRISEHHVDEDLANRHERAAKYLNWPMLLMMEWRSE